MTQHDRDTLESLVLNPFENQHATGNERNIDSVSDMLGSLNPDHNYYTNLVPRLFPLVEERPWLGLVTWHTEI